MSVRSEVVERFERNVSEAELALAMADSCADWASVAEPGEIRDRYIAEADYYIQDSDRYVANAEFYARMLDVLDELEGGI